MGNTYAGFYYPSEQYQYQNACRVGAVNVHGDYYYRGKSMMQKSLYQHHNGNSYYGYDHNYFNQRSPSKRRISSSKRNNYSTSYNKQYQNSEAFSSRHPSLNINSNCVENHKYNQYNFSYFTKQKCPALCPRKKWPPCDTHFYFNKPASKGYAYFITPMEPCCSEFKIDKNQNVFKFNRKNLADKQTSTGILKKNYYENNENYERPKNAKFRDNYANTNSNTRLKDKQTQSQPLLSHTRSSEIQEPILMESKSVLENREFSKSHNFESQSSSEKFLEKSESKDKSDLNPKRSSIFKILEKSEIIEKDSQMESKDTPESHFNFNSKKSREESSSSEIKENNTPNSHQKFQKLETMKNQEFSNFKSDKKIMFNEKENEEPKSRPIKNSSLNNNEKAKNSSIKSSKSINKSNNNGQKSGSSTSQMNSNNPSSLNLQSKNNTANNKKSSTSIKVNKSKSTQLNKEKQKTSLPEKKQNLSNNNNNNKDQKMQTRDPSSEFKPKNKSPSADFQSITQKRKNEAVPEKLIPKSSKASRFNPKFQKTQNQNKPLSNNNNNNNNNNNKTNLRSRNNTLSPAVRKQQTVSTTANKSKPTTTPAVAGKMPSSKGKQPIKSLKSTNNI